MVRHCIGERAVVAALTTEALVQTAAMVAVALVLVAVAAALAVLV